MVLSCMNCKKETSDGKLFAEAFVCPDCHLVATRLYDQGERELRQVQMTLKELIRVSIVEGRLSFAPPPEAPGTQQPRRAIDAIVDMMKKEPCHDETQQPSTASDAPTPAVAGKATNASTQVPPSRSETPSTSRTTTGSEHA